MRRLGEPFARAGSALVVVGAAVMSVAMFLPVAKGVHPMLDWRYNGLAGDREGLYLAALSGAGLLSTALWYSGLLARVVWALGTLIAGSGALVYASALEPTTIVEFCERCDSDIALEVARLGALLLMLGGVFLAVGSVGQRRLALQRQLRPDPTGP